MSAMIAALGFKNCFDLSLDFLFTGIEGWSLMLDWRLGVSLLFGRCLAMMLNLQIGVTLETSLFTNCL